MKIATYNVWNDNKSLLIRTEQLISEIRHVDADIIGFQEVTPEFWKMLVKNINYPFNEFHIYHEENEGLAFLSKYPIRKTMFLNSCENFDNSSALNIVCEANNFLFSVTNLHLPWDSINAREKQIIAINNFIHMQEEQVDFFIMLGDFNCTHNSSVHNFLLGEQTLSGFESKPCWVDLASTHAALNNYNNPPTLDFTKNPRWKGENTLDIPTICDWILIRSGWHNVKLNNVSIFGMEVSHKTTFAPSDHYGVLASVNFAK